MNFDDGLSFGQAGLFSNGQMTEILAIGYGYLVKSETQPAQHNYQ